MRAVLRVNIHSLVPLLRLRRTVSLSSVFKPVADLCGGQPGSLGQLPLLPRGRVRVVGVPLPQYAPALLFEAVAGLLTVPDRPGQGELSADTVLSHRTKRAAPELLRFNVVRLEPQLLQLRVVVRRELVALEDFVKLPEVSPMEGDYRLGFQDAFILVKVLTRREGPQKASQPLDVTTLLQNLTNARHLLLRKAKSWKHRHDFCSINAWLSSSWSSSVLVLEQ